MGKWKSTFIKEDRRLTWKVIDENGQPVRISHRPSTDEIAKIWQHGKIFIRNVNAIVSYENKKKQFENIGMAIMDDSESERKVIVFFYVVNDHLQIVIKAYDTLMHLHFDENAFDFCGVDDSYVRTEFKSADDLDAALEVGLETMSRTEWERFADTIIDNN